MRKEIKQRVSGIADNCINVLDLWKKTVNDVKNLCEQLYGLQNSEWHLFASEDSVKSDLYDQLETNVLEELCVLARYRDDLGNYVDELENIIKTVNDDLFRNLDKLDDKTLQRKKLLDILLGSSRLIHGLKNAFLCHVIAGEIDTFVVLWKENEEAKRLEEDFRLRLEEWRASAKKDKFI